MVILDKYIINCAPVVKKYVSSYNQRGIKKIKVG